LAGGGASWNPVGHRIGIRTPLPISPNGGVGWPGERYRTDWANCDGIPANRGGAVTAIAARASMA
jgi:hypothetical protein